MTNDNIKNVNNFSEMNVEKILESYLEPYRKEIRVRAKMSVKDVFTLPQEVDGSVFSYYLKAHFDFVICSILSNKPLFAVEYDGPCHDDEDAERRDDLKNYLCDLAGFTVMRISYQNELRDMVKIIEVIKNIITISQSQDIGSQSPQYMPQSYYVPSPQPVVNYHRIQNVHSGSVRKNYDIGYNLRNLLHSILMAIKRTRLYRFTRMSIRVLSIFIVISLVFSYGSYFFKKFYDKQTVSSQKNTTGSAIISKSNADLVLSFVVGKHPGSRGTYIEIRDGNKTLISGIYKEGSKMMFYKNKKLIVTKAGSDPKTFQLTNNLLNLEVANNYTKVYHNEETFIGLRIFKYDYSSNKIIKK